MFGAFRSAVAAILGRSTAEREMADELQFHIEQRAADLTARGLEPDEARRRARLEFGAVEAYKERCREARSRLRLLHDVRSDLIYAFRIFRRSPSFAVLAVLSLALGLGVNTLVFSVVNALVVRPLPIDRPAELFALQTASGIALSYPAYRDVRDRATTMAGLIGYRIAPMSLDRDSGATRVWGYLATGNYFDVLGIEPVIGRFFHPEDDRAPGASPFAVLSYDCWMERFLGDRGVIGRSVRINGYPYTVLGVAPRGFRGTELFYRAEVWVPMMMQPLIEARSSWLDSRETSNTWVAGRVKRGVTTVQAEANLSGIATDLAREFPSSNRGLSFRLVKPGLVGDALGAPVKAFTLGVLALASLVLLASCANLAVLLTARGSDRQRELAIRLSIGAGRARLVRQLLTETLLLAIAGGIAGAALAFLASRALSAWHAPIDFPIQFDVVADTRVFLFAFAVSVVAGALFGVAPAQQASRTDPNAALKGPDGASSRVRGWPLREVLVALQVALCVVLVSACLLSLRGLQQAMTMPIGFEPRGVTMAAFELGLAGYDRAHGEAFQRRALEAIRQLPGVSSAAYSNSLPLSIDQSSTTVRVDDPQGGSQSGDAHGATYYRVSPGFVGTMGLRLVAGREFEWRDNAEAPAVAVVNQTFARTILKTTRPLGVRFHYGPAAVGRPVEVIGVVEDGKYRALNEAPQSVVFEPILQQYNSTTTLVVRSTRPSDQVAADIRRAVAALDPRLPVYGAGGVQDMLGLVLFPSRAAAIALGAFGLLAIILAATGLHGVVSYAVSRREREIGIRIAIGARSGEVLRLVLARTAVLLVAGAALGFALSWAASQVFASIVYQASPHDPLVMVAVGAGMILVGVSSCWVPAHRALRVSPILALRSP